MIRAVPYAERLPNFWEIVTIGFLLFVINPIAFVCENFAEHWASLQPGGRA